VKVKVLKGHDGSVVAVEWVSVPKHTFGARTESGTLVALANQDLAEVEVALNPSEGLSGLLDQLGIARR
jgi:hypothetical protein